MPPTMVADVSPLSLEQRDSVFSSHLPFQGTAQSNYEYYGACNPGFQDTALRPRPELGFNPMFHLWGTGDPYF